MQATIARFAGWVGLILVSAIPSYAQTEGRNSEASALDAWRKKIVIQLMSNKTFPPGARDQSGTAKVKFAIDRQGKLLSKELVESTGSELLDAAAIGMVERTEPFPEPPAEVTDDKLSFTVPVIFAKRKQLPWAGGQWPAEWIEEQKRWTPRFAVSVVAVEAVELGDDRVLPRHLRCGARFACACES